MLHIDFSRTICARILSILLPEPVTAIPSSGHLNDEGLTPTEVQYDPSYYMCLARWVMWSIDTWSDVESETDIHLRRDVTESLMQALGHCLNEARPKENVAYVHSSFFEFCDVCSYWSSPAQRPSFKPSALKSHDMQLP